MKKDGGRAFPSAPGIGAAEVGMSLRDYFAAKAMQALVATDSWEVESVGKAKQVEPKHIAKEAYLIADAMLAEMDKR